MSDNQPNIVVSASHLNGAHWIELLNGIGTTNTTTRNNQSFTSHGYLYLHTANKSYEVTWDRDSLEYNPAYQRVPYEEIIKKTGQYLTTIKGSDQAPKVRQVLQHIQKRHNEEVQEQFCFIGRMIHRIVSWITNVFTCRGCATTEGLADRYIRSIPQLPTATV